MAIGRRDVESRIKNKEHTDHFTRKSQLPCSTTRSGIGIKMEKEIWLLAGRERKRLLGIPRQENS